MDFVGRNFWIDNLVVSSSFVLTRNISLILWYYSILWTSATSIDISSPRAPECQWCRHSDVRIPDGHPTRNTTVVEHQPRGTTSVMVTGGTTLLFLDILWCTQLSFPWTRMGEMSDKVEHPSGSVSSFLPFFWVLLNCCRLSNPRPIRLSSWDLGSSCDIHSYELGLSTRLPTEDILCNSNTAIIQTAPHALTKVRAASYLSWIRAHIVRLSFDSLWQRLPLAVEGQPFHAWVRYQSQCIHHTHCAPRDLQKRICAAQTWLKRVSFSRDRRLHVPQTEKGTTLTTRIVHQGTLKWPCAVVRQFPCAVHDTADDLLIDGTVTHTICITIVRSPPDTHRERQEVIPRLKTLRSHRVAIAALTTFGTPQIKCVAFSGSQPPRRCTPSAQHRCDTGDRTPCAYRGKSRTWPSWRQA